MREAGGDGPGPRGRANEEPASVEIESLLRPRASGGKRAIQAGSALLAVLVALVLVLHGNVVLGWWTPTPRATPTSTAVPTTVQITSNVTFGTLTVNGKAVRAPLPATVALANGDNQVTLSAPPFRPQTCHVLAPVDPNNPGSALIPSGSNCELSAATQLDILFTKDDLPPDVAAAAVGVVQGGVASMPAEVGEVPIGQYYATGLDGNGLPIAKMATESLSMTVTASLCDPSTWPPPSATGLPSQGNCGFWQPMEGVPPSQRQPPNTWAILAPITLQWTFTTALGRKVGTETVGGVEDTPIVLAYDGPAGWHAVGGYPNGAGGYAGGSGDPGHCDVGTQLLLLNGVLQKYGYGISGSVGPATAAGCEMAIAGSGGTTEGRLLWRFGALLAEDRGAHALLPSLPMAPAAEIAAVRGTGGG